MAPKGSPVIERSGRIKSQFSYSPLKYLENERLAALLAFAFIVPFSVLLQGCGAAPGKVAPSSAQTVPSASLQPSSANIQIWQNVQFSVASTEDAGCTWQSSQPSVLASLGDGQFQGNQTGTAEVSVTCGSATATATVSVAPQQPSGPITITSGGTYSGNWTSTSPNTPAVT